MTTAKFNIEPEGRWTVILLSFVCAACIIAFGYGVLKLIESLITWLFL